MNPISSPAPERAATSHAAEDAHDFTLAIDLGHGYTQTVAFDEPGVAPLTLDEPPPLGAGEGPTPARLLGAAVGGCLGASLVFCMRKARVDVSGLHTHVTGTLARNERGRLRVSAIRVRLEPVVPAEQHDRVPRCLALFEDFCTVTQSVRQSIDVQVEVVPRSP